MKWSIDLLRLLEWECYQHQALPPADRLVLGNAFEVLNSSTFKNVGTGLIVKPETKRQVSMALATCLRNLPQLPFGNYQDEKLAQRIELVWACYERLSERLSSWVEGHDFVLYAVLRQATVELAIRAGAMSELVDDNSPGEDVPIWSTYRELQEHLRDLAKKAAGSREKLAAELGRSDSEVDGWIYELDSPPIPDILKWERLLATENHTFEDARGRHYLWRLYLGVRLWQSAKKVVPESLQDELLKAYCRIKRKTVAFFALDRRTSDATKQLYLSFLLFNGQVATPELLASLTAGESDILWIRHIEAAAPMIGPPTRSLLALAEFYNWAAFGFEEGARLSGTRLNQTLDDFLRDCLQSPRSQGPMAEWMRLCEEVQISQDNGDLENAVKCIELMVRAFPNSAAAWNSLGRSRYAQRQYVEAEKCYRRSLERCPNLLDSRSGLALVLALNGRAGEALTELEAAPDQQKSRAEYRYAHGVALLKAGQAADAKNQLLICAEMGFKLSACYHWLAEACEQLGLDSEKRQFRKQAAELEGEFSKQSPSES